MNMDRFELISACPRSSLRASRARARRPGTGRIRRAAPAPGRRRGRG